MRKLKVDKTKMVSLFELVAIEAGREREMEVRETFNMENIASAKPIKRKSIPRVIREVIEKVSIIDLLSLAKRKVAKISTAVLDKIVGSSIFCMMSDSGSWKVDSFKLNINGITLLPNLEIVKLTLIKYCGELRLKELTLGSDVNLNETEIRLIEDNIRTDENLVEFRVGNTVRPDILVEGEMKFKDKEVVKSSDGMCKLKKLAFVVDHKIPKKKGREVWNEIFEVVK